MPKRIFILFCLGAIALLLLTGCRRTGRTITIKGSDTMVNLMGNLAESYMHDRKDVRISVTGGGSGTGIEALLNQTTDICSASRTLSDREREQAKSRDIRPVETVIGLDGLAVMVNPRNPVSELSIEQLRNIYTGQYTNWSSVGGPTQEIVLLSRDSNSGTHVYFQEHVLNQENYAASARSMSSTAAIVQAVSAEAAAIGYGGVAYAADPSVKIVKIRKSADSSAVAPTGENVHNVTYPISRPLFLYTDGRPMGAIKEFVDYCASPPGQAIVKETGYMPVKE